MKKTLYSLMLEEDLVREIDLLAHRMGTNRSNLINRILAEYVGYETPERRINDIFTALEALISPSRELVPFFAPNSSSMSLKSSLEYKYRPTVKYELELFPGDEGSIGRLSLVFRTQSEGLIALMTEFFRLWIFIENRHLPPSSQAREYKLYEGRFTRSIASPGRVCGAEELAQLISDYVTLFDSLMKAYLAGRMSARDVEQAYCSHVSANNLFI